jgi:hypothetical protein
MNLYFAYSKTNPFTFQIADNSKQNEKAYGSSH